MMLMKMKHACSRRARGRRAASFRRLFPDAMNQPILDLGGGDGKHIALVVPGLTDIDRKKLAYAETQFGHKRGCFLSRRDCRSRMASSTSSSAPR